MAGEWKTGDVVLDRFRIERAVPGGGMGAVYIARDIPSAHQVAIKVLYPMYHSNTVVRERFMEEGRIQAVLRHPNIVRVYQINEEPDLAIIMEYVDGPTLDAFLADQGPLDLSRVVDVIIPLLSAIGFAHSNGIIHRDIKPSNVLLRGGDLRKPKILDFGVAKVKHSVKELTATGTTVGTLHYMSPEQIVGSKTIDGRADIYSIGVTMYKLVTGEVPFNASTEFALMMAQVESTPRPPTSLNPSIPAALETIILKAMEKKPQDRFSSIKDFTSALLALRIAASTTVHQSITNTYSSELLDLALGADRIAVDRARAALDREAPPENTPHAELHDTEELEATLELEGFRRTERPTVPGAAAKRPPDRGSSTPTGPATQPSIPSRLKETTGAISEEDLARLTEASRAFASLRSVEDEDTTALDRRSLREAQPSGDDDDDTTARTRQPPATEPDDLDGAEDSTQLLRLAEPSPSPRDATLEEEPTFKLQLNELHPLSEPALDEPPGFSAELTIPRVPSGDHSRIVPPRPTEAPHTAPPSVIIGTNPADTNERTAPLPKSREELYDDLSNSRPLPPNPYRTTSAPPAAGLAEDDSLESRNTTPRATRHGEAAAQHAPPPFRDAPHSRPLPADPNTI